MIEFSDFTLTNKNSTIVVYLKDKTIIVTEHICHNKEGIAVIIGRKFLIKNSLSLYPCDSQHMNIFVVQNLSDLLMLLVTEILNKVVQLPFENTIWCCMPLLHSSFS